VSKKLAKAVIDRHKRLKAKRLQWDDRWREVNFFVLPNKDNIYGTATAGEAKYRGNLYDSSAVHYNELLASALHSMLTNPSVQWFELTTGNREFDSKPEIKTYLQRMVRKIHQVLNNSNFQTEIHEIYLDLGAMGTGVLTIMPDKDNIMRFAANPIYNHWIEEDARGQVNVDHQEDELTLRQILDMYPKAKGLEKFAENKKLDDKYVVIKAINPRENRDFKKSLKIKTNKKYASVHVLEKAQLVLKEDGFDTFPAAIPRWIKTTGETYGRSPSMKALPDVRMLNVQMKTHIRAGQKVVDPPLMVPDDGFLGRVNTTPGAINAYRSGSKDLIFPLETGGNLNISFEMLQDNRDRIKQHYFIDQLQLKDGPQMTATEVNQRVDEHLRLLGPVLGRLHFELLGPAIGRVIEIMKDANELPDNMPDELKDANIDVFFSSQIAKAQRFGEARTLQQFMETMAGVAQINPAVLDNIDFDMLTTINAELYGVNQEIFRGSNEVQQLRDQRAQAEQEAARQQQEQHQAEVANKVAPAVQAQQQ